MATKGITVGKPLKIQEIQERAMTMALATLLERVRSLSKEDQTDLYDLMKEIVGAETDEEWQEAASGMLEILDQEPVSLAEMDCVDKTGSGLKKWLDFVSEKIRQLRLNAGFSQVQLAERSGLPQSHISRLESGKHSPSRITLEKISKALSVELSELDPSA